MIIEELHYHVDRQWNELGSNQYRKLSDLELDSVLNTAISEYEYMFVHGNNRRGYEIGFEVDRQMLDMVDTLVFSYPEQVSLNPTVTEDVYIFDLTEVDHPFSSFISGSLEIEDCNNEFTLIIHNHGDKQQVLKSAVSGPSKKWERAPGFLRSDKLYVHTNNLFAVEGLKLTYTKKPDKVCLGTYTEIPTVDDPNPPLKVKVECDLPESYHELLVKIAVQELQKIFKQHEAMTVSASNVNNLIT